MPVLIVYLFYRYDGIDYTVERKSMKLGRPTEACSPGTILVGNTCGKCCHLGFYSDTILSVSLSSFIRTPFADIVTCRSRVGAMSMTWGRGRVVGWRLGKTIGGWDI